jgi:hypothetical protein
MLRFAGVLPYFLSRTGQVVFVLGRELNGLWNPFGGGPESADILREAARECEEETMGFFGSKEQIALRLVSSIFYQTPTSITYFLRLYLNDIGEAQLVVDAFRSAYQHLKRCNGCPEGYLEMNLIGLFTPEQLVDEIDTLRPEFRANLNGILEKFQQERLTRTLFI